LRQNHWEVEAPEAEQIDKPKTKNVMQTPLCPNCKATIFQALTEYIPEIQQIHSSGFRFHTHTQKKDSLNTLKFQNAVPRMTYLDYDSQETKTPTS